MWGFLRDFVFSPPKAVRRLKEPRAALPEALRLYALFWAASVLFYALKPPDFPPLEGGLEQPLEAQPSGLWFWAMVATWNAVLTAVWTLFLAWFCSFLKTPLLRGMRGLLAAGALSLLPLLPILLYKYHSLSAYGLVAAWLILFAAMAVLLRKRPWPGWKPLLSFALALDSLGLVLLPLSLVAVLLRSVNGYHALEIGALFWTLGLGSYALSRLEGLSTARAFAAIFLAMVCQFWFVFLLYCLGLVSKEALAAMILT